MESMVNPCLHYVQECPQEERVEKQNIADHFRFDNLPDGTQLLVSRCLRLFSYRHYSRNELSCENAPSCECGATTRQIVGPDGKPVVYTCPDYSWDQVLHILRKQLPYIYLHSSDGNHHFLEEELFIRQSLTIV